MKKSLDEAEPLAKVLWRVETEGKDFATPERRAGLERSLAEIVSAISDPKIADYYRRDFEQQVFDQFKRRTFTPRQHADGPASRRFPPGQDYRQRPAGTVSPAVKNSLLARSGNMGARRRKEIELAQMLLEAPKIAFRQGEILAALPFADRSLDRLRREVLDLAASGSSLEKKGLENHLIRTGLGELLERLGVLHVPDSLGGEAADAADTAQGTVDDIETRWLRAAEQLREMAEIAPERMAAMERFKADGSEESWQEAHRLLARGIPNE